MFLPNVRSLLSKAVYAVILVFSVLAHATDSPAILTTNTPVFTFSPQITGAANGGTVGWAFTVNSGVILTLNSLGLYDGGDVALQNAHPVALWDASQNLLTEVTIPSGVGANYLSGYTYQPITNSVTLSAGSYYYVGAYFPAGSGDKILVMGTSQQFNTNITFSNPRQSAFSPAQISIAFPDISNSITGTYKEGWFGPTFSFTASVIPEPSPNAILILSLVVILIVVLQRKWLKKRE